MGKGGCGRTACTLPPQVIQQACQAKEFVGQEGFALRPHYNCGPGHHLPVLFNVPKHREDVFDECEGEENQEGDLVIKPMRWGLVPSYTKADTVEEASKYGGNPMINARSDNIERVHKRLVIPSSNQIETRRCAVVVDGFFEWHNDKHDKGKKVPYYITRIDKKPLLMAALFDVWRVRGDKRGTAVRSCIVVTTDVRDDLVWLHDRMPAILEGDSLDAWLDNANVPFSDPRVQRVLSPYDGGLEWREVPQTVNNIRNNVEECIMPLALFKEKQMMSGIGQFFKPRAAEGTKHEEAPKRNTLPSTADAYVVDLCQGEDEDAHGASQAKTCPVARPGSPGARCISSSESSPAAPRPESTNKLAEKREIQRTTKIPTASSPSKRAKPGASPAKKGGALPNFPKSAQGSPSITRFFSCEASGSSADKR